MVKMKKADLTKRLIAESLEKCLKTKRLEKISVTEIMRMANMTRQMFYHYFQDINALIYWIHLQRLEAYTEEFYESKDFGNAKCIAIKNSIKISLPMKAIPLFRICFLIRCIRKRSFISAKSGSRKN